MRHPDYPDDLLFVSTILKRLKLTIPRPKTIINLHCVYVLCLRDHSAIKFGMTSAFLNRARSYVKTANYLLDFDPKVKAFFDTDRSIAFAVGSKAEALAVEKSAKQKFADMRAPSPLERNLIRFGMSGHTEWLDFSAYDQLIEFFSISEVNVIRESRTLSQLFLDFESSLIA
jgi:hypothetical protein